MKDTTTQPNVAQKWIEVWKDAGQEPRLPDWRFYREYVKLPRWWKSVYDLANLPSASRVLEVGCGSGRQLLPIALHGYPVTGLDCSIDALKRCRNNVAALEILRHQPLSVSYLLGDFLQMAPTEQFPLVFSCGVLEHFLDSAERRTVINKLRDWTVPGGVCVTWVPNGMHPLRQAMRQRKLGGYDVPEIDYGIRNLYQEMLEGGFTSVTVTPLDLFGYRLVCENPGTGRWWFFRGLNLISKVIPPGWMPLKFRERHAYALASVGRVAMR